MSKIENANVKCNNCGHVFETKIWTSLNTHARKEWLESFFDKSMFDVECPSCHERIHLQYNLLYHDMDYPAVVWYSPDKSEESVENLKQGIAAFREMDRYTTRIVFSQDRLIEKAQIFKAGLDDRIIEVLKAFAVVHCNGEIENFKFRFAFFECDESDNKRFLIFSENETYTYTFSEDFYNEIREVASDLIESASEGEWNIDFDWADKLSFEISDRLPQDEDNKMEEPESSFFICKSCGGQFETEYNSNISSEDDPEILNAFFDSSLFHKTCPECGREAILDDVFAYTDVKNKAVLVMVPLDYPDREDVILGIKEGIQENPELSLRIVDSVKRLIEKAKIFHLGLDDRIIEILKVFEVYDLNADLDANYSSADLYFDVDLEYEDPPEFFGPEEWSYTVTTDFYNAVKNRALDLLEEASKGIWEIDHRWAEKISDTVLKRVPELDGYHSESNSFFRCSHCGQSFMKRFPCVVTSEDDPTLLKSFFNGSLFKGTCPGCGGTTFLDSCIGYIDLDHFASIAYIPKSYADEEASVDILNEICGDFQTQKKRIVGSVDRLIEKAKIFRAGMDDRIIELEKVEASRQYKEDVENSPDDFFKDSFFDGTREFAVFKFDETLRNGMTCPIDLHDELKEKFSDVFDKYSDGIYTIDYAWAKQIQLILIEETQKHFQKSYNTFLAEDIIWEEPEKTYEEIWKMQVPFVSPYKEEDYIKNGKIDWKREEFTAEERLLMAIFDEDKKLYESLIVKNYEECLKKNDFSIFSKQNLDRARELVNQAGSNSNEELK